MSTTSCDSLRDQSFFVVWQCSRNMWLIFLIIFYYQFHSTFGQLQNFRQFDTGMNIINDGIGFINKMAFSEVFLVFIYWRCFVSQKKSYYTLFNVSFGYLSIHYLLNKLPLISSIWSKRSQTRMRIVLLHTEGIAWKLFGDSLLPAMLGLRSCSKDPNNRACRPNLFWD